jgi:hypothetical protein
MTYNEERDTLRLSNVRRSVSTPDGQQVSLSNVDFSSSHESQMEKWRDDGRQGKNRRAVNILRTEHIC